MDQSFSATWIRNSKNPINRKPHPPYCFSENQQVILETVAEITSSSESETVDFLLEVGIKYLKNNLKFQYFVRLNNCQSAKITILLAVQSNQFFQLYPYH